MNSLRLGKSILSLFSVIDNCNKIKRSQSRNVIIERQIMKCPLCSQYMNKFDQYSCGYTTLNCVHVCCNSNK